MRLRWASWTCVRQAGLVVWLLLAPWAAFSAEPRVVASIKPIHALVAGVMQGVGAPRLLAPGGASPHDYSLRPSDARAIAEADVVFWVGPELEGFLVKPLDNAKDKVRSVALLDAPEVTVWPLRQGGAWETHDHGHAADDHDHAHDRQAGRDPHLWLDPVNAAAMVRRIVAVLSEIDPLHRADYQHNGAMLIERLDRLNQQLAAGLASIQTRPYIVFHDAYQYFERRYGLDAVGSIVLHPEQRPSARRVAEIQDRIGTLGVRCVFSEPQFQPALIATVIGDSGARQGVFDPLGAELSAGPDAYFLLLSTLSDALRNCLGGS